MSIAYSKTFKRTDYEVLHREVLRLKGVMNSNKEVLPHHHLIWQAAMGLRLLFDVPGLSSGNIMCHSDCEHTGFPAAASQMGADVCYYPFPCFNNEGKADLILSLGTANHVLDDFEHVKGLSGMLGTGGLLFLAGDYHPSGNAAFPGHMRAYNAPQLRALVPAGFELLYNSVDWDDNDAGNISGIYTFFTLVARKVS